MPVPKGRRVLISACLFGLPTNLHGRASNAWEAHTRAFIRDCLDQGWVFVPICPEQLGGLATPRAPAELQAPADQILDGGGRILTNLGTDVTDQFLRGAHSSLQTASTLGITVAIFKSRSPSCSNFQVHSGTFTDTLIDGVGLTTALLRRHGIKVFSELDWIDHCRSASPDTFLS